MVSPPPPLLDMPTLDTSDITDLTRIPDEVPSMDDFPSYLEADVINSLIKALDEPMPPDDNNNPLSSVDAIHALLDTPPLP